MLDLEGLQIGASCWLPSQNTYLPIIFHPPRPSFTAMISLKQEPTSTYNCRVELPPGCEKQPAVNLRHALNFLQTELVNFHLPFTLITLHSRELICPHQTPDSPSSAPSGRISSPCSQCCCSLPSASPKQRQLAPVHYLTLLGRKT